MSERISWVAVGENPDGTTTWFYAFSSKPKADKFVALYSHNAQSLSGLSIHAIMTHLNKRRSILR